MEHKGFDKFADWVAEKVASAYFFAFCLALVTLWLIGLPIAGFSNDLYHLLLNSPTTAITFLLVAVSGNDQHRFEKAVNERLEALMEAIEGVDDPVEDEGQKPLKGGDE